MMTDTNRPFINYESSSLESIIKIGNEMDGKFYGTRYITNGSNLSVKYAFQIHPSPEWDRADKIDIVKHYLPQYINNMDNINVYYQCFDMNKKRTQVDDTRKINAMLCFIDSEGIKIGQIMYQ